MKSTSATFKQIMASGNTRNYVVKIYITFADGTTLPNNEPLTEEDIWMDSFKIETASSGQSSFDIGSAIIGECRFQLNNWDERFNQYDFFNAQAVVWVGLVGDETNGNQNYIRMGFFTVDEPTFSGTLVNLTLLDNMWKFDVPVSDANITFDSTTKAIDIVQAICTYCGVTLGTQTFHGYNFSITQAPDSVGEMNCRELLQYIAMIGCNFCIIDDAGALRIKWYDTSNTPESSLDGGTFDTNTTPYSDGDSADGGNFTNYNSGASYDGGTFLGDANVVYFSRNYQTQLGTDEITITGVKFTINDVDHRIGTTGYVLELENPLVTESNVNSVLNLIWDILNGFKLRTFNIKPVSDLSCEVGDCCAITDLKGNVVYSYITLNSFGFTDQTVECNAITQSRSLTKRYSKAVQAVVEEARKQAENAISDYDLAVQNMNNLAVNAMGGYEDYDDLPTGGRVYYLSNRPITKDPQTGLCVFEANSTVFKLSGDGFFVSINGGSTWTNGYAAGTGQLVVNVLNAIGLSAEWIKVGDLTVGGVGSGSDHPRILVKDAQGNQICLIDQSGITMNKGYIASSNYAYTSGHFSDTGTKFDITNDYLRSPYFAFDENGAYINGQVEASSGQIGGATITQDAILVIGDVELYSGSGTFKFRPTDYYFTEDFKLTLHTEGSCTVTLVKHENGSDTTEGTYSVTSYADVETVLLDHEIGLDPDDYYQVTVSGSSCVVSALDVILAYMGEGGFRGTLRGIFKGNIDANGTFKGYLASEKGIIAGTIYSSNGNFVKSGQTFSVTDGFTRSNGTTVTPADYGLSVGGVNRGVSIALSNTANNSSIEMYADTTGNANVRRYVDGGSGLYVSDEPVWHSEVVIDANPPASGVTMPDGTFWLVVEPA